MTVNLASLTVTRATKTMMASPRLLRVTEALVQAAPMARGIATGVFSSRSVVLAPCSTFEDVGCGGGGQGALEPLVELGEVGARLDLHALRPGRAQAADVEDLEQVFASLHDTPLLDTLLDTLL